MTPLLAIVVLLVLAGVLLFGELLLPTGGLLAALSAVAAFAAIAAAFWSNVWWGFGMTLGLLTVAAASWPTLERWWVRSPVGRRLVLSDTAGVAVPSGTDTLGIGDVGVAVTALRPMGECEFSTGDGRDRLVQCVTEGTFMPAGTPVRVVAVRDGTVTVRQTDRVADAPQSVTV